MDTYRRSRALLPLVCALAMIQFLPCSAGAAEGLQSSYQLKEGTINRTFDIAVDEIAIRQANGTFELRQVRAFPNAEAMRQYAVQLTQAGGLDAQLVLYPTGSPRTSQNRRIASRRLIAQLAPGVADPNAIATDHGLTYLGLLTYTPGYHLFESAVAGGSLTAAPALAQIHGVLNVEVMLAREYIPMFVPNDPIFTNQWHLLNTGQTILDPRPGRGLETAVPGIDVNITNVWERYRGSGITMIVMDTGMDLVHADLAPNLNTNLGLDVLAGDNDPSFETNEFHATAVAGIAAARGNNGIGVSGAAPEATIIPVRLLAGVPTFLTDQQMANGILHLQPTVHVHNNSWGPGSQGFDLNPLSTLMSNAIVQGINVGRAGRGTIYVFSAGNSGSPGDNGDGNQVGQVNSRYTIAVGALLNDGRRADYSTPGACLVISAPAGIDGVNSVMGSTTSDITGVNGYNNTSGVGLPDLGDTDYTQFFNGTSSAAPLVSGVIALILEANPLLGWRDVQEIIIRTARKVATNDVDWVTNAAGYHFNHQFGAGMINADAAVQLATNWSNLGIETTAVFAATNLNAVIPELDTNGFVQTFTVTNDTLRLEHVRVEPNIQHPFRGQLAISITSPSGITSRLFEQHLSDANSSITNYDFMTVHNWGELANGNWTVRITDLTPGGAGVVNSVRVWFHGSFTNSGAIPTNPPVFVSQPVTKTKTQGSTVDFGVTVSGASPLFFQWLHNGTTIPGANQPTLRITNVQPSQAGQYTARVVNQFGEATSFPALLFVNAPPIVNVNPVTVGSRLGSNVTFSVAASGGAPLTYLWRKNGVPITGAIGSSYAVSSVTSNDFGVYDVLVSNDISSVFSSSAALVFLPPWSFTEQPVSQAVSVGANVQFSVAVDQSGPFTFQWSVNSTNIATGTNSVLQITNASVIDSGTYSVLVGNSAGSLASSNAVLTVFTPFSLGSVSLPTNGDFGISIGGDNGRSYRLEGSTDLSNWVAISTNIVAGGTTTLTDTAARAFTNRFYRVVLLP